VSSVDRHHDLGRGLVSRLQFWRRRDLEVGSDAVRSISSGRVIFRRTRQKCFQEPRRLAIGMPGAQLRLKPPQLRRASVRKQIRQGRPRDIHKALTVAWAAADARRVDRDGPEKRLDFPGPSIAEMPEPQKIIAGGVGMENKMRLSRSTRAEAGLACGFVLMALVLAVSNSVATAAGAMVAHHHAVRNEAVDPRATAQVPASPTLFSLPSFGSYVPAPRKPETDGLSRNPNDCVKYGCIDNGG
jgi:hypothetical protein